MKFMNEREIKIKLNQWITEMKIFNIPQLLISINGVYFWTDRIVYDDEHCWLYLNKILIGFVNLNDIHFLEKY